MEYQYKISGNHHSNEIWTGCHIIDGKIKVWNFQHYATDVFLVIDQVTNEIVGWSFAAYDPKVRRLTASPVKQTQLDES